MKHPPELLLVLGTSLRSISKARQHIEKFQRKHAGAPVICFDYNLQPSLTDLGVAYWREHLLPAQEMEDSARGHAHIADFVGSISGSDANLYAALALELNSEAFKACAAARLLAENRPLLVVVASTWTAAPIAWMGARNVRAGIFLCMLACKLRAFFLSLSLGVFQTRSRLSDLKRQWLSRNYFYVFRAAKDISRDWWEWSKNSQAFAHQVDLNEDKGPGSVGRHEMVVVLEDCGTGLNLNPTLPVLDELSAQGIVPVVLTSTPRTVEVMEERGQACALLYQRAPDGKDLARRTRGLFCHLAGRVRSGSREDWLLGFLIAPRFWSALGYLLAIRASMSAYLRQAGAKTILGINEAIPSCMVASALARETGAEIFFYLSVLIFDHPESKLFPHGRHLVYGDQARDLLIGAGTPPELVESVGSTLYDTTIRGNRSFDRERVQDLLPDWQGQPIVVIGTEHRAQQMQDIEAVLGQIGGRQEIYVVIKVHPADSLEQFEALCLKMGLGNVKIVGRCDLEALLAVASLLICQRSNIIITALLLGTPTLVCDFNGSDAIVDFEREGIAIKCASSDEIWRETSRLVFDQAYREKAIAELTEKMQRFNGPNDGNSAMRVVSRLKESVARQASHQKVGSGNAL